MMCSARSFGCAASSVISAMSSLGAAACAAECQRWGRVSMWAVMDTRRAVQGDELRMVVFHAIAPEPRKVRGWLYRAGHKARRYRARASNSTRHGLREVRLRQYRPARTYSLGSHNTPQVSRRVFLGRQTRRSTQFRRSAMVPPYAVARIRLNAIERIRG